MANTQSLRLLTTHGALVCLHPHPGVLSAMCVCLTRVLRHCCDRCNSSGGGDIGRRSAAVAPHVSEAEMRRLMGAGDHTQQILHDLEAARKSKSPAVVRPAASTPGGVDDSDSGPEG